MRKGKYNIALTFDLNTGGLGKESKISPILQSWELGDQGRKLKYCLFFYFLLLLLTWTLVDQGRRLQYWILFCLDRLGIMDGKYNIAFNFVLNTRGSGKESTILPLLLSWIFVYHKRKYNITFSFVLDNGESWKESKIYFLLVTWGSWMECKISPLILSWILGDHGWKVQYCL